MRIGELAQKAAVNIQTIRFYERRGLLRAPLRNSSGYRAYEKSDLDQVTFIKRNQELGFTLEEIKQILHLHSVVAAMAFPLRQKPAELSAILAIGRERLACINQKARTLRAMGLRLTSIVRQLEAATVATCPASTPARRVAKKHLQNKA
ncbi:MAG TPA: MerR family transcriptional regulator [Acidobacteriaceae bacterium]